MLIFTFECDIRAEHRKRLEDDLIKRTGEDCLVIPCCSGVVEVHSKGKSTSDTAPGEINE